MAGRKRRASSKGRGDFKYLVQPRGDGTTWYVSVAVPRTLRAKLQGKKALLRSLATTDINVARAARWGALKDLKADIERIRTGGLLEQSSMHQEALEWRDHLTDNIDDDTRDVALDRVIARAEEIGYRTSAESANGSEPPPADEARAFFDLATGRATPIDTYIDRWLDGTNYTDRTKADARTALRQFEEWCTETRRPAFLENVVERTASDFRDQVFVGKVHSRTANKKLSLLRQYWVWLERSLAIRPNPWLHKSLPKVKVYRIDPAGADAQERPFTDNEVQMLLDGGADTDLADLMMVAALSGMRLEEIGQLRIGDCLDQSFTIHRGKSAAAVRSVPIHTELFTLIARRVKGRSNVDFLFRDLKDTGWDSNRTMAVSKRFTRYRRNLGIDDQRLGARRSKINFHSFRRWFATKCEDAGIRENVVADVMGHKKAGMSFGLYSGAELTTLKRACIESVKLLQGST